MSYVTYLLTIPIELLYRNSTYNNKKIIFTCSYLNKLTRIKHYI